MWIVEHCANLKLHFSSEVTMGILVMETSTKSYRLTRERQTPKSFEPYISLFFNKFKLLQDHQRFLFSLCIDCQQIEEIFRAALFSKSMFYKKEQLEVYSSYTNFCQLIIKNPIMNYLNDLHVQFSLNYTIVLKNLGYNLESSKNPAFLNGQIWFPDFPFPPLMGMNFDFLKIRMVHCSL